MTSPWSTDPPRPPRPTTPPPPPARPPGPPARPDGPGEEPARVVRGRDEIEHLLDDALATRMEEDPTLPHFVSDPRAGLAGVIATAEWLLGHTARTPITRDVAAPTRAVWSRERGRALDVVEGTGPARPNITDDHAAFVRRTLDWAGIPSAPRPL